jgi:hypothetical protein
MRGYITSGQCDASQHVSHDNHRGRIGRPDAEQERLEEACGDEADDESDAKSPLMPASQWPLGKATAGSETDNSSVSLLKSQQSRLGLTRYTSRCSGRLVITPNIRPATATNVTTPGPDEMRTPRVFNSSEPAQYAMAKPIAVVATHDRARQRAQTANVRSNTGCQNAYLLDEDDAHGKAHSQTDDGTEHPPERPPENRSQPECLKGSEHAANDAGDRRRRDHRVHDLAKGHADQEATHQPTGQAESRQRRPAQRRYTSTHRCLRQVS